MRQAHFSEAASLSQKALDVVPYNADYAFSAASALAWNRAPSERVRAAIDRAIELNPLAAAYPLLKARYELRGAVSPDRERIKSGYQRALDLNPNDVATRLEFADALADALQRPRDAIEQYQEALRYNDALHRDEGKRLRPEELDRVQDKIHRLEQQK
jgi:tetratricopeptide (TPR) repeat protein